jgi:glutamate dehydrogenase
VVKQPATSQAPHTGDANVVRAQGLRCYKHFISALLSVVDTSAPIAGQPMFGGVVRHDGSDPYLVVAADKGTASFSDTANVIALQRSFWLGDAFASGGSAGYDHKAMGITARGAWVSADHHLRALGIDPLTQEFSAVGIGDMSGDVFGNGMLIRPKVKLIAAFDHRHIFVDPQPQVERAYAERQRLFELSRSSWDDYHRDLISAGGGVWPRTAKTIPVSAQMRDALAIADDVTELTPNQIIGEILRAPVDLVFNGGIGTYVKASTESHAAVSDKVNDSLRVDAGDVRARAIVEGGNLGVSPEGRIEYARSGGLINTDAIDNAAGVDCSDHEVNIKILLELATQHGALNRAERNALLAEMTGEVTELILANNRAHSRLLGDARFNAPQMVDVHARMTTALETRRKLIRAIEHLPTATEYARLAKDGDGLCVPQLATLMAHVKLDLKAELLADDVLDDAHFGATLQEYFPARLRRRLGDSLPDHPLRREIIATSIVNHVLATSGLTYAFRLSDETAAATSDIVRAHAIVSKVFDLDSLWSDIYAANLDPTLTNKLIIEGRRLLDRASRWFLLNRPQPLDIDGEISRFAQPVAALRSELSVMLRGDEKAAVTAARQDLLQSGVPALVAQRISEALYAFSLLDIVEIALAHGEDARRIAAIYFELSDHVGVDRLLLAVSSLPREDRWHSLARLALREDLYRSLRELALDVARRIAGPGHSDSVIEEFELYNRPRIERARRTLVEFMNTDERDLAVISVASAQLRRLSATQA